MPPCVASGPSASHWILRIPTTTREQIESHELTIVLREEVFMSVVNISSPRNLPEADHEPLGHLAVSLSRRLTRVGLDDLVVSIADGLQEIAAAIRAEGCRLFEFAESATVARVHVPSGAQPSHSLPFALDTEAWLVERLWRGELVAISRPEELPREAIASRGQA